MKFFKFIALQINALFPFLYPLRHILKDLNFIRGPFAYFSDYRKYKKLSGKDSEFPISLMGSYPIFYERYEAAGSLPNHYGYLDLWGAKKVLTSGAKTHYDIGSRFDGFVSHCLVFCKIVMLDIRPLKLDVENLSFIQANCFHMPQIASSSIDSISSLHAVEHFGLGRYGDPIDPFGYQKAISEIKRVTAVGGNIYFAVPIGRQRVEFNAHRIFNPSTIIRLFQGFDLIEFSVVDDNNIYIEKTDPEKYIDSQYACGLFHFRKASL